MISAHNKGGECSIQFNEEISVTNDAAWCREEIRRATEKLAAERGGGIDYPTDVLFQAVCMARENHWTWARMEKLLDIIVQVLDFERENPMCTMEHSFHNFKQRLLLFSCERPPWTIGLYTKEHVQKITEFIMAHHFRHFRVHKHLLKLQTEKLQLVS
uniref:Uncharacterized protein n=1 Tax=Mucochytrium quahogii TaxID=96639 RepID=A0A7S2WSZ8_9STRA|mmetsp:Transcript_11252/g.18376  ORF Transcript_11252/g.18376 Transcript_11252/m.18376 type:complete len:158 (+) Transcript_11252:992-1465(+)